MHMSFAQSDVLCQAQDNPQILQTSEATVEHCSCISDIVNGLQGLASQDSRLDIGLHVDEAI